MASPVVPTNPSTPGSRSSFPAWVGAVAVLSPLLKWGFRTACLTVIAILRPDVLPEAGHLLDAIDVA